MIANTDSAFSSFLKLWKKKEVINTTLLEKERRN